MRYWCCVEQYAYVCPSLRTFMNVVFLSIFPSLHLSVRCMLMRGNEDICVISKVSFYHSSDISLIVSQRSQDTRTILTKSQRLSTREVTPCWKCPRGQGRRSAYCLWSWHIRCIIPKKGNWSIALVRPQSSTIYHINIYTGTMSEIEKALHELDALMKYRSEQLGYVEDFRGMGLTSRKNLCLHPSVKREKSGSVVDARCRSLTAGFVKEKKEKGEDVPVCIYHDVRFCSHPVRETRES